jgi:hypothetical protein
MMPRLIAGFAVAGAVAVAGIGQPLDPQLSAFLTQVGVSQQQRASLEAGKPVAKVLSWGESSEVYVFGAVHINGSAAAYLESARNVTSRASTQGYLGIGEIPATPMAADLSGLSLDPDDIKALKSCREGDCDVQLPSNAIQAFRDSVNWSQPDAAAQVNALARSRILDLVREYRRGGNEALGVYRDKEHPARVAKQFEVMVSRAAAVPEVVPQLRQYLLRYPDIELPGADSFFYWEKVDFGMKPTIRVNHGVIYQAQAGTSGASAVAIKQLYASHYFHTALDVSICLPDRPGGNDAKPESRGFYLLTLKGSEQDGLTGIKGSMLRKIVVDKTRSSLEKALGAIKDMIERSPNAVR